jgi:nitroreductase
MGLLPKIPKDNFGSLMFNDALSNYLTYHSLTSERPTDLEDLDFGQVKIDLNFPLPLTKRAQFNENRLEFLRSRKSVRDFSEKKIELETLRSAVEVAKFAPSQCNRQTVKLYYTSENSKLKKFLTLQGGANGFSESVPGVVVVASSLKGWLGANQRNQCFVDGGIFAHQLLLSLNASGIDACPLNLAVDNKREIAIKDLLGIPEHMRLIMSIAVGYASQDKVKIAQSRRRHVDDILEIRY